jgi:hypothetical protein
MENLMERDHFRDQDNYKINVKEIGCEDVK